MGYKLPDGRYVDDQGKAHKNYNDALAASRTRASRRETEAELARQRILSQNASALAQQAQLGKQYLGWIPGYGGWMDKELAKQARLKAEADLAISVGEKQNAIWKAQMGEGSAPPTIDPSKDQAPPPVAPGLQRPDSYGDPAARARESEQRRMMQQYASKEYWNTEQGKAMKDLALQDKYEGDNLAGYYAAQRALGEGSIDEIIQGMGYTGAMAEWARANKGMALREYMKKFPAGQPTMGAGEPSAPTIDQAKPTVGEQALMNAKYALYDGAPVAPGVTIGNEPGVVAGVNRSKMAELQAIVPQAKSTGAGERAFNMQPESSAASWPGVLSANAGGMDFGKYNLPDTTETPEWMDWNKLVAAKKLELAGYDGKSLF